MLRRIAYLALAALALLLLMSLMVVSAESAPEKEPFGGAVPCVLPARQADTPARPTERARKQSQQPLCAAVPESAIPMRAVTADANGIPVLAGPYRWAAYFAFCFTGTAG